MRIPLICAIAIAAVFLQEQIQAATYNLTVLADHRTQPWNRFYETAVATDHMNTLIHTYWGRGVGNALKIGHDEAGFKYFRGHAVLDADVGLVAAATATTLTLNWTRFDSIYNLGMAAGMRPVLEISCTPPALALDSNSLNTGANYNGVMPVKSPPTKYGWAPWVALMDSIVVHCEAKWGVDEVRNNWYFEVWNEPDWWYTGFTPYLTLFDYTVFGLKKADSLVRVGGPACEGTNIFQSGANFTGLLNHCHTGYDSATQRTGTKIDFLSYHWYADNSTAGITGAVLNANNSAAVQKMVLDSLRSSKYNWFTGLVSADEMGPTYNAAVQRDMHQSASWLAKTIHLLNENGPNYPPPLTFAYWALSDLYEEVMTSTGNLSFQTGNFGMLLRGDSAYANSWDIEKPVFQAYRLLHRLGAFEDSSYGGTTGNGVNLIATSDSANDSIQILVYDHYASTSQNASPTDDIALTVSNIPWAPGQVRIDHYLIDTTHSNAFTKWVSLSKPAAPTHAQWDSLRAAAVLWDSVSTQTLATAATPLTLSFSQHYFSVSLFILSNGNGSAVSRQHTKVPVQNIFQAAVQGRKLLLTGAGKGPVAVRLFSIEGRNVFEWAGYCPGSAAISLPQSLQGVFMLHCRGQNGGFTRQIVLKR